MGLIERLLVLVFGGGRNVIAETAEVFRANAENEATRSLMAQSAALSQFGAEFLRPRQGMFDRVMDGLNRVPRPALAFGTLGLFVSAMVAPDWFAARMAGIALVPDPLWWLLGAIVSFYFGARYQEKGQAFQKDIARTMTATLPGVMASINQIEGAKPGEDTGPNPALAEWRAGSGGGATM